MLYFSRFKFCCKLMHLIKFNLICLACDIWNYVDMFDLYLCYSACWIWFCFGMDG